MKTVITDTPNLFVQREDGVSVEDEVGPSFVILLRNFPTNLAELQPEHKDVLRDRVVPFIASSGRFAEIYGMTDRSGARAINYKVGGQRVAAVQQKLKSLGAEAPKVDHAFAKAIGEDFWEHRKSASAQAV